MAKTIKPEDLGAYLKKKQGEKSEAEFAVELDISRPSLRALKASKYQPRTTVLSKIGLAMFYRTTE